MTYTVMSKSRDIRVGGLVAARVDSCNCNTCDGACCEGCEEIVVTAKEVKQSSIDRYGREDM